MKLTHDILNKPIVFNSENINIIYIECSKLFYTICNNFIEFNDCLELYKDNKKLNPSKSICIITDYFNLNINTTKNLSKLYLSLTQGINSIEKNNFNNYFINFIQTISFESNYNLTYDLEINYNEIYKSVSLQIDQRDNLTFLEKLISYISISRDLNNYELFVLINIKVFMNDNDIEELYKYCIYNKINLLLLETKQSTILHNEKVTIIDKDFCIID
ncbi:MAG: type II-A CRISPR-associated protein Csn2 [bacterium]